VINGAAKSFGFLTFQRQYPFQYDMTRNSSGTPSWSITKLLLHLTADLVKVLPFYGGNVVIAQLCDWHLNGMVHGSRKISRNRTEDFTFRILDSTEFRIWFSTAFTQLKDLRICCYVKTPLVIRFPCLAMWLLCVCFFFSISGMFVRHPRFLFELASVPINRRKICFELLYNLKIW
jgi:hypothetical protein